MVSSRSRGSIRPKAIEASGTKEGEAIRNFLEGELPPGEVKQAAYLTTVLLDAGARYDRYTARKEEWISYANRRNRLVRITKLAGELISSLCELDILSRDDLASRLGLKEVEALIGSIHFLSRETSYLANGAQKDGRPRDLAEERWILEVADLYENAFRRPARIWGSGDEKVAKRRGKFYQLMEISRPPSFLRYGKLSLRQIERTLRRRRDHKSPLTIALERATKSEPPQASVLDVDAVFNRLREFGKPKPGV